MTRIAAAKILGCRVRRHQLDRHAPVGALVATAPGLGEFLNTPVELAVAA